MREVLNSIDYVHKRFGIYSDPVSMPGSKD